jgi:putative flippase GtrA
MNILKQFITNKDHTGIQFFKYAACGCFALTVDMLVSFLIAWLWLRALKGTELFVKLFHVQCTAVPEETRTFNFIIGSIIAFVISNLVAYILNVLFVFKAGKHSRLKEIGLFYAVSGVSIGIGVALGALVVWMNFSYDWSYVTKALSAAMINYVVRKKIIFKG